MALKYQKQIKQKEYEQGLVVPRIQGEYYMNLKMKHLQEIVFLLRFVNGSEETVEITLYFMSSLNSKIIYFDYMDFCPEDEKIDKM